MSGPAPACSCLLFCPRYAFDDLSEQPTWALSEIKAKLPEGLGGMFLAVMKTLTQALQEERPDLMQLLRRLLPVLVAARDSLTVEELAWATDTAFDKVCLGPPRTACLLSWLVLRCISFYLFS